jgi:hypothetical protein
MVCIVYTVVFFYQRYYSWEKFNGGSDLAVMDVGGGDGRVQWCWWWWKRRKKDGV